MKFLFRNVCDKSSWRSPALILVYLVIANASLIVTIIAVAVYLNDDVGYHRSKREFLFYLQRAYDMATYLLFGIMIFLIITNLISLAIRLKVIMESVDYITQQVNQQRKEYKETVGRFVYDAFLVKKYYENELAAFQSTEELPAQSALRKHKDMKKERTIRETMNEISKHLTALNNIKIIVGQSEKKQFDTKFLKLIDELKSGQMTSRKDVSRIKQNLAKVWKFQKQAKLDKTKSSLSQRSIHQAPVIVSKSINSDAKMKCLWKSTISKSMTRKKSMKSSPGQESDSSKNDFSAFMANIVKSQTKQKIGSSSVMSELNDKSVIEYCQSMGNAETKSDRKKK
ncbi:Transient receptor potential cation channel subfamily M member [Dirofilaria immitis]